MRTSPSSITQPKNPDVALKEYSVDVKKMKLTQIVNKKAAHWLIMNWDSLDVSHGSYNGSSKREHDPEIQREMFITYYNQLDEDGEIEVHYLQNKVAGNFRGRMFNRLPQRQALQSITRRIRQTICIDNQTDVDMCNAHPSLLSGWCKEQGIISPCLDFYILNREKCLKEFSCSRDEAKTIMLAALNGQGKRKNMPEFYNSFHAELNDVIREKVIEMNQLEYQHFLKVWKEKKRTKKQIKADGKDDVEASKRSLLSMHLNDMENTALMVGVETLSTLEIGVASLIYDGLHIYTEDLEKTNLTTAEVCDALAKSVFEKMGYKIKWEIKPFKNPYILPDLEDYDDEAPFICDPRPPQMDADFNRHLTWYDFVKKYKNKVFSGEQAVFRDVKFMKDFNSVFRYFPNSQHPWVIYSQINMPFKEVRVKDLSPVIFRFNTYDDKGKVDGERQVLMKDFIPKHVVKLPNYSKLVFKPHNHGMNRGELNKFMGFKAKMLKNGKSASWDICAPFFNHIKKVWANNNEEIYKYLMKWLSSVVQRPWERTNVFILLTSKQGAGKGVPCDFLINKIFGNHCAGDCAGLGKVTQRFNSFLGGKVFLNVNEMSDVSSKSFYANFDKLKALITDSHLCIERKGRAVENVENCLNLIGSSNAKHTMNAETGDRRILALECSNDYIGNFSYFKELIANLQSPMTADHIFTYLFNYKSDVNLKNIPETALKKELEDSSQCSSLRFLNELDDFLDSKGGNDVYDSLYYKKFAVDEDEMISKDKLFEWYKSWGDASRERIVSRMVFFKQIRERIHKVARKTLEGKRVNCIKLNNA